MVNKMCLWNTKRPQNEHFLKNMTLIFEFSPDLSVWGT